MGQSTTFYRISSDSFKQLKESDNRDDRSIFALNKGYIILQGTNDAIEFLLSKDVDDSSLLLVREIFYPSRSLGDPKYSNQDPEDQMKFYKSGGFIRYLDSETVLLTNELLSKFPESYFREQYNSKELNTNGIYPEVWHDANSNDLAFNEDHLIIEVMQLKFIFDEAAKLNDYVLILSG